jgi:hypothetical protein
MVWITQASPGGTGRVEASTNMDVLAVAGELLYFASLARPKIPSGANAFEISDIQEEETEV